MCELTKHSANFIFLIPILLDLKTYQKCTSSKYEWTYLLILSRVFSRFFDRVGHDARMHLVETSII